MTKANDFQVGDEVIVRDVGYTYTGYKQFADHYHIKGFEENTSPTVDSVEPYTVTHAYPHLTHDNVMIYSIAAGTRNYLVDSRAIELKRRPYVSKFDITADISRQYSSGDYKVHAIVNFNDGSDYPIAVKYYPDGNVWLFSADGIAKIDSSVHLVTKPEQKPIQILYVEYRIIDDKLTAVQSTTCPRSDSKTYRIERHHFDPNSGVVTTENI